MTDTAQIQHLAGALGIKWDTVHFTQTQLIREIQMCRGEEPCFASNNLSDCAEICEWRRECRPRKAAWLRW